MIDHERIRRQVIEQVINHPETLDMDWWAESVERGNPANNGKEGYTIIRADGCGTSACIAGWAVHFATDEEFAEVLLRKPFDVGDAGQYLLGLTDEEAAVIFFGEDNVVALDKLRVITERDAA